jgi:hypothetical protein
MNEVLDEFDYRRSVLQNLNFREATSRLSGFAGWLDKEGITRSIVEHLEATVDVEPMLLDSGFDHPPSASTPEEIAAIGLYFIRQCQAGGDMLDLSSRFGIEPPYSTSSLQDHFDNVMNRFIDPAIDFLRRELEIETADKDVLDPLLTKFGAPLQYPLEITESLAKFSKDYPEFHRNAFVMMKLGRTTAHDSIIKIIRSTLSRYGIHAFRADDKQYHDDLFPNVLTYIYGCRFGIAVFERLEQDEFNPNVSLEFGYMNALKKSVCLLKDKTLRTLQTDLVGKLYKTFDPQDITNTIPPELESWLRDKDLINI